MKNRILLLGACACGALFGCVDVDEQTAEKPFVYWKAASEAMPAETLSPEQIKTDKILSAEDAKSAKPEKRFVRATDKIAAGEPLALVDLIDIALENNTSTRTYWFQAKSYAASLGKANSAYYPQVSVSGSVYRARTKPSLGYGAGLPVGRYYETGFGPSAEINWLLCDFGKRGAAVESARYALYAANFEYNRSIQEVVVNVNLAYCSLFGAMGNVESAKLAVEDAKSAFDSASEKFKSGVGNKPDMLNALANLRNAEFALQQAGAGVETARANLASVMGVKVGEKLAVSQDIELPKLDAADDSKIEQYIASAMRSRPDLLANYAQLEKSKRDIDVAKRAFLPQISASAAASYTDYSQHGRNAQDNMQVGVGITWSIFEGFSRKYDLISAKMSQRAAAQKLRQNQVQIMADIWSCFYSYKSSLKQLSSAEAAVEANQEAYLATKTGYENGVNSVNDFLNAQTRLASARQQLVLAKTEVASSVAKLAYATGALSAESLAEAK